MEHRDTQTYFEEMLNIVLRRGDDATAEKLALSNYKSIKVVVVIFRVYAYYQLDIISSFVGVRTGEGRWEERDCIR